MDKIHNKASKLFDDIRKKKNTVGNNNTGKDITKNFPDNIANLSYKCCIYCHKVFVSSKFLMKHLLRRHSEELILFYRNCSSLECKCTASDLQHVIATLRKEFSTLKKELLSAKLIADGKFESDSFEENHASEEEETIHNTSKNQNARGDSVSSEIKDLKEKMLDVEKDIGNLNEKFIELDDVLKNEVLMKHNIGEKLALSEERIMQAQESQFIELKQLLSSELKSILFKQQQENSNEWKSQLLELRHEIKRLDYAIDCVKKQLVCTDSLKEEIRKELVPHIIPHISKRKCKKQKIKSSPNKTKLSVNKSYQSAHQQEISDCKKFSPRESNSKNSGYRSEVTLKTHDELASLVADKLSQFSILPNTSKISCIEYSKTLKLLSIEKERLFKMYDNFDEVYNDINMRADQRAHRKLKSKKHHRIKFSEPLTSSRNSLDHSVMSLVSDINEQSSLGHNVSKQHTYSKTVSQKETSPSLQNSTFRYPDKGASGDSNRPFSTKQNMLTNKQSKFSSVNGLETSSHNENMHISKDLNVTFSKESSAATSQQSKFMSQLHSVSPIKQRKLNSAAKNISVQLKPVLKTLDKLSELEDECKSEDDFDDVSSLETYESSNDDDDH